MKKIFEPNFSQAENLAYEFLRATQTTSLPIKLKDASKIYPNLKIMSYSKFGKIQKMTIEEVCDFANSAEGCCFYKKSTKQYLILYNDTVKSGGRKRWTIAHELGHFMLKHNEKSSRSIFNRSSLSSNEYDVFEKEANCFARTILAPTKILLEFRKFDANDLARWCDISKEAAINILKFFNKAIGKGLKRRTNDLVVHRFSDYIYTINNQYFCSKCKFSFVLHSPFACPICSNKKLSRKMGDYSVRYEGYTVDETGKVLYCPICDNEEILDGEYCKICGLHIVNKCTNVLYDRDGDIVSKCETIADGNARFCYKCGEKTTFFQNKILSKWDYIKPEISDDDLPF